MMKFEHSKKKETPSGGRGVSSDAKLQSITIPISQQGRTGRENVTRLSPEGVNREPSTFNL